MSELQRLTKKIKNLKAGIDWEQFGKYKDIVLPLLLETGHALKHFQFKSQKDIKKVGRYLKANKDEIGEELADILYWVFMISHALGIDIKKSFDEKMAANAGEFPLDVAKRKKASKLKN